MRPLKGKLILSFLAFAVLSLGSAGAANAGSITFSTGNAIDLTGTGFGTRLTVLSLQNNGTETGATTFVAPLGTGDSTNQDSLLSIAALQGIGVRSASEVQLIYNLNQQGNADGQIANLTAATATFYDSAGGIVATASLTSTFTAAPFNQGNGGSGYIATFNFTAEELVAINALFASGQGFFGLSATITNANDGADSFFVRDGDPSTAPIPEPATMILLGTGLAGVAAKVRKRRKGEPEETV